MLRRLSTLFSPKAQPKPASVAADFWSKWQSDTDAAQPRWIEWGQHPVFLDLIHRQAFGSEAVTVFHHLKAQYAQFADSSALSLCSGDGRFERQLIDHGVFGNITGLDISPYRVEKAQALHATEPRLDFVVGDVNSGDYGTNLYDVVFAKAALHHIENLEASFAGMLRCLRPGGHLVTVDFFGPSRFQWSETQLTHANRLLQTIPAELRTDRSGVVKTTIGRPTIADMIAADPSEAVRSAEAHGFVTERFSIVEEYAIGGTLFNLIFTPDVLDHFEPEDAGHRQMIGRIFDEERALIERGALPSDFRFIVAEKKN